MGLERPDWIEGENTVIFSANEKEYLRSGMAEAVKRAGGEFKLQVHNKTKISVQSVGNNFVLRLIVKMIQKTISLEFSLVDPNVTHFKVPCVKLIVTYTGGSIVNF